jgi:hypothetical protein
MRRTSSISPRRSSGGAGRRSDRLKVWRRPSSQQGGPDKRPDPSQAAPKPLSPPRIGARKRSDECADQHRHRTSAPIRTIEQQTQHAGTARGWFDSMLRAAGRQMVRGVAFGGGDQTTRPKRRKHDSSHQENPGDAIVAVHTHASPNVLHLYLSAKVLLIHLTQSCVVG